MTRVSKKLRSFFRSIISLIHGNGLSSFGNRCSSPICVARRFAMSVLLGKLAIGGASLALVETILAKMRIFRAPEFLATAFLLGVLALLVHLLLGA